MNGKLMWTLGTG